MIQRETNLGFAHAVRYMDLMICAWKERAGRDSLRGISSEEVPPWITVPTNEERGRAEVIRFLERPLQYGESYSAYLSLPRADHKAALPHDDLGKGVITTWTGELLAVVTRITSFRVRAGFTTDERGSFWARGIDGRTYYGRHNGRGIYCNMRLAKHQH